MSIKKRLFNVAKAEIRSAGRKVGDLFGGSAGQEDSKVDEELKEMREQQTREKPREKAQEKPRENAPKNETALIRRYYANLELPIGAPLDEVKASYRRLMRRYHPDLHQKDAEAAAVATRLTQELRTAYDGLVEYLSR